MTGKLSKNFHGVGIGPLSKILAVNKFACKKKSDFGLIAVALKCAATVCWKIIESFSLKLHRSVYLIYQSIDKSILAVGSISSHFK